MSYQNTGFVAGSSKFVKVLPSGTNNEAVFTSKNTAVPVTGGKVNMVSASVALQQPKDVTISAVEGAPKTLINESVKVSFNVVKGSIVDLNAIKGEVDRLLDLAVAEYNLANGLVPPANATFPLI